MKVINFGIVDSVRFYMSIIQSIAKTIVFKFYILFLIYAFKHKTVVHTLSIFILNNLLLFSRKIGKYVSALVHASTLT